MTSARPRVAVVGAGPSGLYAAAALAASGTAVDVDVLDRLPAPYGLVRYGVAPDHVKMKSVVRVLARPFGPGEVRFLGGVAVGDGPGQVPLAGAARALHRGRARLRLRDGPAARDPGRGPAGQHRLDRLSSAGTAAIPTTGRRRGSTRSAVAVVGAGNVALDVARVLARTADELVTTDVPDAVLDVLRGSAVRDVHVLVRRGPQQVKFTPVELRQLGDLADAEVVVHDDGLLAAGVPDEVTDRHERANLAVFTDWAHATPGTARRRIHLRFLRSPVRILGADRVTGVVVERNVLTPDGRVRGTGEEETLDVGLVVRAVGYTAEPIPGLPFDSATGTVPNVAGRVIDADGTPVVGQYVTGWIRRGPTGVIGTNKHDAVEVAAAVLADLPTLPPPAHPDPDDLADMLAEHDIRPVDWTSWLRLDAEEIRLGQARGADRVKVAELAEMLAAVHGATTGPESRN